MFSVVYSSLFSTQWILGMRLQAAAVISCFLFQFFSLSLSSFCIPLIAISEKQRVKVLEYTGKEKEMRMNQN